MTTMWQAPNSSTTATMLNQYALIDASAEGNVDAAEKALAFCNAVVDNELLPYLRCEVASAVSASTLAPTTITTATAATGASAAVGDGGGLLEQQRTAAVAKLTDLMRLFGTEGPTRSTTAVSSPSPSSSSLSSSLPEWLSGHTKQPQNSHGGGATTSVERYFTPIHLAAHRGHVGVMRVLLDDWRRDGERIDEVKGLLEAVVQHATADGTTSSAGASSATPVVPPTATTTTNADAPRPTLLGSSRLLAAAEYCRATIRFLLSQHRIDLMARNRGQQQTCLHVAASVGHWEIIDMILEVFAAERAKMTGMKGSGGEASSPSLPLSLPLSSRVENGMRVSPLWVAIVLGHAPVVARLMRAWIEEEQWEMEAEAAARQQRKSNLAGTEGGAGGNLRNAAAAPPRKGVSLNFSSSGGARVSFWGKGGVRGGAPHHVDADMLDAIVARHFPSSAPSFSPTRGGGSSSPSSSFVSPSMSAVVAEAFPMACERGHFAVVGLLLDAMRRGIRNNTNNNTNKSDTANVAGCSEEEAAIVVVGGAPHHNPLPALCATVTFDPQLASSIVIAAKCLSLPMLKALIRFARERDAAEAAEEERAWGYEPSVPSLGTTSSSSSSSYRYTSPWLRLALGRALVVACWSAGDCDRSLAERLRLGQPPVESSSSSSSGAGGTAASPSSRASPTTVATTPAPLAQMERHAIIGAHLLTMVEYLVLEEGADINGGGGGGAALPPRCGCFDAQQSALHCAVSGAFPEVVAFLIDPNRCARNHHGTTAAAGSSRCIVGADINAVTKVGDTALIEATRLPVGVLSARWECVAPLLLSSIDDDGDAVSVSSPPTVTADSALATFYARKRVAIVRMLVKGRGGRGGNVETCKERGNGGAALVNYASHRNGCTALCCAVAFHRSPFPVVEALLRAGGALLPPIGAPTDAPNTSTSSPPPPSPHCILIDVNKGLPLRDAIERCATVRPPSALTASPSSSPFSGLGLAGLLLEAGACPRLEASPMDSVPSADTGGAGVGSRQVHPQNTYFRRTNNRGSALCVALLEYKSGMIPQDCRATMLDVMRALLECSSPAAACGAQCPCQRVGPPTACVDGEDGGRQFSSTAPSLSAYFASAPLVDLPVGYSALTSADDATNTWGSNAGPTTGLVRQPTGLTPLALAVHCGGDAEGVELILSHGANVNAVDAARLMGVSSCVRRSDRATDSSSSSSAAGCGDDGEQQHGYGGTDTVLHALAFAHNLEALTANSRAAPFTSSQWGTQRSPPRSAALAQQYDATLLAVVRTVLDKGGVDPCAVGERGMTALELLLEGGVGASVYPLTCGLLRSEMVVL